MQLMQKELICKQMRSYQQCVSVRNLSRTGGSVCCYFNGKKYQLGESLEKLSFRIGTHSTCCCDKPKIEIPALLASYDDVRARTRLLGHVTLSFLIENALCACIELREIKSTVAESMTTVTQAPDP